MRKGSVEDLKLINSLCSNLPMIQHVLMEREKGIAEKLIMKLHRTQHLSCSEVDNISNIIWNLEVFILMRMRTGQPLQCLKCKSFMMRNMIILNNLLRLLILSSSRTLMN